MSFPSQGYTPTTVPPFRNVTDVTALARTANQEWFASDIVPTPNDDFSSEIILQFSFTPRAIIEVTFDSGTTWLPLNNRFRAEADTLHSFLILARNSDLVNFRATVAGTINIARVIERI